MVYFGAVVVVGGGGGGVIVVFRAVDAVDIKNDTLARRARTRSGV